MARAEDKTVLVVDDEPDVRRYLAAILRDAGFRVLTAGDGEEAIDIARRERPDFISLDLVMPKKSGQKVLFELRRDRDLARIPVLIVTAHAQDDLGREDLGDLLKNKVLSGPGAYLEKPVRPADYVRCVQRALGLSELPETDVPLAEQIQERIGRASPEALRRALAALRAEETHEHERPESEE